MIGDKLYIHKPDSLNRNRLCVVNEYPHPPCPLCKWADGLDSKVVFTPGPDREIVLLRVRNLLETRAILRARSDMDNLHRDGWCMDYQHESHMLSVEIDRLLDSLEAK